MDVPSAPSMQHTRRAMNGIRFEGLGLPESVDLQGVPAMPAPSPRRLTARQGGPSPARRSDRRCRPRLAAAEAWPAARCPRKSGFGEILAEIGRGQGELASRWRRAHHDHQPGCHRLHQSGALGEPARHLRSAYPQRRVPRQPSWPRAQRWGMSPKGQHIELGIAEQNLFLLLGAAGLTHALTRRAACCRSARCTTRSSIAASMR